MNISKNINIVKLKSLKTILNKKSITIRNFSNSKMTKGELFKYQDNLPSLPVPKLKQTLDLYKETIKPYYPNGENDPEFLKYSQIIDEFGNSNEGLELQTKLENFAVDKRNWLSEFWDNYAYLDYRDPVSPFVSYFFHHKDFNTKISKDQILKSTAITIKILQFMESIENETLSPELIKNAPFCMEGFKWMFNNARVPGEDRDYNLKYIGNENRFIIIISNNHIYKLQTHDSNDKLLNFNEIFNGINSIKYDSIKKGLNKNPIGILTSSNRDEWFKNYENLKKISIKNQINLENIFKSSFVLCLDDNLPNTIESKARNAWHGNGTNRWFDKPIQIVVSKNGSSGFLGEHSRMDGTPNARMNDWLVSEISNFQFNEKTDLIEPNIKPEFKELTFDINPQIENAIKTETEVFNKTVNSLDIKTWQYFGFGKDDIKLFKASPDSFVQMLIQLAYYKYTGVLRPTYESASTRKYFKGRTETCRSVSIEALKFVQDWENTSIPIEQKLESFRAAIKSHGNYIKLASSGFGVDRHLFGLKQMLDDSTKDSKIVKEFFNNPVSGYSQYWYNSTSQLSSENFNGWGFAPVVPEGFGLAYMINKNWLHINITAFKENPFNLKVDEMAYFLTVALQELNEALTKESLKAKL
jgi:carnitine O-acetyltransferase